MPKITDKARNLRNNPTEAEKLLWRKIQHEQIGVKFRRQHPVPPYIVDFYCPDFRLVIEVDGGQHNENKRDDVRTEYLENLGYKVLRFWNNDVLGNIDGVLQIIAMELKALPPDAPPPISGRGGKGGRDISLSSCRSDFPVMQTTMNGKRLAFLDTAASAQKPHAVIDAMNDVYQTGYANIHRGLYRLSSDLTERYETIRSKVASFIGADSEKNVVFTRNATEGVNLVAMSWGHKFLRPGDEIILTEMEHHANIVPWQILRDHIGIVIKTVPFDERGVLDLNAFEKLLSPKTKLVSFVHISNALGTINPAEKIIGIVRKFNSDIKVLIDGSQAVVHAPLNLKTLDADFYVFTGHKLYGPTGIGVLYGKDDVLDSMPPYQGGGDMIERVTFEKTTYKEPPYRFEAGTPPIIEVIGLGAAIDYLSAIGMDHISAHEKDLLEYGTEKLNAIDGLKIHGTAPEKAGILSFTMEGAHPSDIGMVLDQCGVAVRTGHHCCMPLMKRMGLEATVRASIGLYTNKNDIDQLAEGLHKVQDLFK